MGLEVLAIGATIVGGVVQAFGAMQQQQSQQAMANYQAQVARNNAVIAQQNATYSRQAAAAQVQREYEKTANVVGGIRAAQASNGLDVNFGSNLDVQSSAEMLGQLNALTVRDKGEYQARAYENQARGATDQAGLYAMQASSYDPLMAFGGSILGTAGTVAQRWATFNNNGINLFG